MSIREILRMGDARLLRQAEPVAAFDTPALHALVSDLRETMAAVNGAGLAAPQIGVNLRAFSYNVEGKLGYLINPELVELSGEKILVDEGCLSVPGLWHKTPRYTFARAVGVDLDGNKIEVEGSGLMAQALQHECDHLDGLVYLDRLEDAERKAAMKNLRDTDWFMK